MLCRHARGEPVKIDDVICLGHQLEKRAVFVALTTFSLALNVFRSLNSGLPVTYQGDSTFKLIKEDICITTANTNELGNINHIIALAIS